MKTYHREWLENKGLLVCDPVALEWGNDTEQVRYRAWAETANWLMLRAMTQDMMSRMLMLEVSNGDDLRNAALELFKVSIIYMCEQEVNPELAVTIGDWLDLQSIEDSAKIAQLVNLLTVNNPNRQAIRDYMRHNL